jgi:O-antigen/teichoic acid export membrane protein
VSTIEGDPTDEGWSPTQHVLASAPLQRRVARGLKWTIAEQWGRQALGFIVFAVLANLLAVRDFGLVATAMVFVAFTSVFVDQGLGNAIVQRRELTRSHIDTAFWAAMATGTLLTLVGVVLAIPIASLLGQPDLVPILQALSLIFVLTALASIQIALLQRELRFRSIATRSLLAVTAGGAVGLAMAYLGYGAWALVGQQLAGAVVSVISIWALSPWRPSLRFSRQHFRELFGFGIHVVGGDTITFFTRNSDNLLIAIFWGPVSLGFYGVAYRILDTSEAMLISIARRAAYPALSHLQADPQRTQRGYVKVTRVASAAILPAYVGLALVAPEAVVTLFGHKWADSGLVAAVLFLVGPPLAVGAFSGSLLYAIGHPEVVLRLRLVNMVVRVVGFIIAVPFGILGVAAAFTIGAYLVLPYNLHLQRRYGGVAMRDYLWRLRGLALATALMAAAVLAVKLAIAATVHPALLLVLEIVTGVVVFTIGVWLFDRGLVHELIEVAGQAAPGRDRGCPGSRRTRER